MNQISIPLDTIALSAAEFAELQALTKRHSGGVSAIFSTTPDGRAFAPNRSGKNPQGEREYLDDISSVLEQLKRSLNARRMNGGRMFVTIDGAFWKRGPAGRIEKVQFVSWRWRGDSPEHREMTNEEIIALLKNGRRF